MAEVSKVSISGLPLNLAAVHAAMQRGLGLAVDLELGLQMRLCRPRQPHSLTVIAEQRSGRGADSLSGL